MEQASMSKLSRSLIGSVSAAVLGVLLFGFSGAFTAHEAAAESPPTPPARFAGSVTLDGAPVAPGTVITAVIGSASCGATSSYTSGAEARYNLDVPALDPGAAPNCGTEGASVTFYVGAIKATEVGSWKNYELNIVNLTAVTPKPSPSPTSGGGGAVVTPKPPATGNGTLAASDGNNAWLFAILGLGTVALGAAGAVAARRGR
jgi:hypothetical protein